MKQLIEQYEKSGSSIIGVQEVPEDQTSRYGIIDPTTDQGNLYSVNHFVGKPNLGTAPSNLGIMGRYILIPDIFTHLECQETGADGEIQLTDAIQKLNTFQRVFVYNFDGNRYDVGE